MGMRNNTEILVTVCSSHNNLTAFQHLHEHVSTSAFDPEDNDDVPRCDPDTRKTILKEICAWIIQTVIRIQWVLWLNGAAGAGKTAIAQSIVQYCLDNGIPIARFFFFRSDPTRNTTGPIVATLVVQLIQSMPELQSIIFPIIEADPLIFIKPVKTQLQALVFHPLRQLSNSSINPRTLVFLFDGVDELNGHEKQQTLIRCVSEFISTRAYPAIALFASRTEPQLNATFREPRIADNLYEISLDNNYSADEDIRCFVKKSFAQIKATHHLRHTLDLDWPSYSHIEVIVAKSSGQFIFATVSLKFISTPNKSPAAQLKIILGLRPVEISKPFAQLDALYFHIFSNVEDKYTTLLVLAWAMFSVSGSLEISKCGYMLSMDDADIYATLAPLAPVINCNHGNIQFLHASLPDFLRDQTRSGEYYIDRAAWCNRIVALSLASSVFLSEDRSSRVAHLQSESGYILQATETRKLWQLFLSFSVEHMSPRLYNDKWLHAYFCCISNSVGILFMGHGDIY